MKAAERVEARQWAGGPSRRRGRGGWAQKKKQGKARRKRAARSRVGSLFHLRAMRARAEQHNQWLVFGRNAPTTQRLSDRTLQGGCACHDSGSSWLTEKNLPSILESVIYMYRASRELTKGNGSAPQDRPLGRIDPPSVILRPHRPY